jgi:hypothetical protein
VPSDFQTFCDAVMTELVTNVTTLSTLGTALQQHKLAPWDPEALAADLGKPHLAVWPIGEEPELATPFTADGGAQIEQRYRVLYWEHIGEEGAQGIQNPVRSAALLTLHNAVRARFFLKANVRLGGTAWTRYLATQFPSRPSSTRWFMLTISGTTHLTLS